MSACPSPTLSKRPLHHYVRKSLSTDQVSILGHRVLLRPLPAHLRADAARAIRPLNSTDAEWASLHNEPTARWKEVNSRTGPLSVVILGTSPSSGCGAVETSTRLRNGTDPKACDPSYGWARQLYDNMRGTLGGRVEVSIWFKNAVGASYFAQCASLRVPASTGIILLEVGCSVWSADLRELVRSLRAQAPAAAVVFVTWPDRVGASSAFLRRGGGYSAARRLILNASRAEGADFVDVAVLLTRLHGHEQTSGGALKSAASYLRAWYAQNGADTVHPSPLGHALTAAAAARHLTLRLHEGACTAARLIARAHLTTTSTAATSTVATSTAAASATHVREEACYERADRLPHDVRASAGWSLVDEGGAKRVEKMGLASTRVGDLLRLGPLPPPRSHAHGCSLLSAELGYLASTRAGMGAIVLNCTAGCGCSRVVAPFSERLYPFPRVETAAALASGAAPLIDVPGNYSVTATTSFLMRHDGATGAGPCELTVRHAAAAGALATAESRVRVDSLTLRSLTTVEVVHAFWRVQHGPASTRSAGIRFLSHAARSCLGRTSQGSDVLAWCQRVGQGEKIDGSLNVTLHAVCDMLRPAGQNEHGRPRPLRNRDA